MKLRHYYSVYHDLIYTLESLIMLCIENKIHKVSKFWSIMKTCIMDARRVYSDEAFSYMTRRYILDMIKDTMNFIILERGKHIQDGLQQDMKNIKEFGMILQIGDPTGTIQCFTTYIKCKQCCRTEMLKSRRFDDILAPVACLCGNREFDIMYSAMEVQNDFNDMQKVHELTAKPAKTRHRKTI